MNADLVHRKSFVITLGLLTAVAALTVDLSLPAIPAMVEALDTTLQRGQKIVGIFMIGMACGQIPAGLFADRYGRLPTLYVGLAIFTISATVAAMANDMELLLAARFVQGIFASGVRVMNELVIMQANPAMAYPTRQILSRPLRPNRSEIGPKISCGAPNPAI